MRSATRSSLTQLLTAGLFLGLGTGATLGQEIAPAQAKPLAPATRASIYDKSADTHAQLQKAMEVGPDVER